MVNVSKYASPMDPIGLETFHWTNAQIELAIQKKTCELEILALW